MAVYVFSYTAIVLFVLRLNDFQIVSVTKHIFLERGNAREVIEQTTENSSKSAAGGNEENFAMDGGCHRIVNEDHSYRK